MAQQTHGVRRIAPLTVPWIEDFVVRTLTGEVRRIPQIVQILQTLDGQGQTLVSDGQHIVLAKLLRASKTENVPPGLYRLIDYEMVMEDASDENVTTKDWNGQFRSSTVFLREKCAVYLSVSSVAKVGGLLENCVLGDPRTLTHSVEIRRVLRLPHGNVRTPTTATGTSMIDAVVHQQHQHEHPIPLGNVAEALKNDVMLAAILQQSNEQYSTLKKEKVEAVDDNRNTTTNLESDDEVEEQIPLDRPSQQEDMGIDAMMVDEEEDEEDVTEPPSCHNNRTVNDETIIQTVEDETSDVTPTIHNHGRISPPPRMAHHAGEVIRAWMNVSANEQPTTAKQIKSPLPKEQLVYGGDVIRTWLLCDVLKSG